MHKFTLKGNDLRDAISQLMPFTKQRRRITHDDCFYYDESGCEVYEAPDFFLRDKALIEVTNDKLNISVGNEFFRLYISLSCQSNIRQKFLVNLQELNKIITEQEADIETLDFEEEPFFGYIISNTKGRFAEIEAFSTRYLPADSSKNASSPCVLNLDGSYLSNIIREFANYTLDSDDRYSKRCTFFIWLTFNDNVLRIEASNGEILKTTTRSNTLGGAHFMGIIGGQYAQSFAGMIENRQLSIISSETSTIIIAQNVILHMKYSPDDYICLHSIENKFTCTHTATMTRTQLLNALGILNRTVEDECVYFHQKQQRLIVLMKDKLSQISGLQRIDNVHVSDDCIYKFSCDRLMTLLNDIAEDSVCLNVDDQNHLASISPLTQNKSTDIVRMIAIWRVSDEELIKIRLDTENW